MEFTPADYYYNDIRRCLQAEAYDIRRRCGMAYRLFVVEHGQIRCEPSSTLHDETQKD